MNGMPTEEYIQYALLRQLWEEFKAEYDTASEETRVRLRSEVDVML